MLEDYLRLERFPTSYCPGCMLGMLIKISAMAFDDLKLDREKLSIVSGIGCTGRISSYFNANTYHGLHGRAIPLALGIRYTTDDVVIVYGGDGDILSIGGNHILHALRRNDDITVIIFNNYVYGMTGGQKAPTTPVGEITKTSPFGNKDEPIDVQSLVLAFKRFYGRVNPFYYLHAKDVIKEAILHKGISVVEVISPCYTNFRRKVYKEPYLVLKELKEKYKIVKDKDFLGPYELGVVRNV